MPAAASVGLTASGAGSADDFLICLRNHPSSNSTNVYLKLNRQKWRQRRKGPEDLAHAATRTHACVTADVAGQIKLKRKSCSVLTLSRSLGR